MMDVMPVSKVGRKGGKVLDLQAAEELQAALTAELFGANDLAGDYTARDDADEDDDELHHDNDDDDVIATTDDHDEAQHDARQQQLALKTATAVAATQQRKRVAVWSDPADEAMVVNIADKAKLRKLRHVDDAQPEVSGVEYAKRLRQQHKKLHANTKWARRVAPTDDSSAAAELLTSGQALLRPSSTALPPRMLETTRVQDANVHERSNAVVRCIAWHPNAELLMTAGMDKRLRFYHVDGVRNSCTDRVYFEDMPLCSAAFANNASQVVAVGQRKWWYMYDMGSGKCERVPGIMGQDHKVLESVVCRSSSPTVAFLCQNGHIPLVDLRSRQTIGTMKMNGTVTCGAFANNDEQLLTAGGDGVVYVWDVRTRRCMHQQRDEGSTGVCGIACSTSSAEPSLACGSHAGVVNLYRHDVPQDNHSSILSSIAAPTPLKTFMNLVTPVDILAFNHDGQMLAMASSQAKDACRIVHVPSRTVFENWPTSRSPLHYVSALAFSPNSGFLAVGNARGHVLLYRMHHFATA